MLRSKDFLYKMMLIREFELAVSQCKEEKLIYGGTHCYNGEEAIAVGVCAALNTEDVIVSNHRPHGHAIAKGVSPDRMMAEMFGKECGTNSGKGGSMHIHDASVGLITSSGIVGSGIPVACGAAFAAKYLKNGKIACVFFGDGSANEGILHECLNIASIWNLPILFVLEDNELAITTNTRETSMCNDYIMLARVYGIEGKHVDGQDVEAVYNTSVTAVEYVRKKMRPYFIQAHTIRFNEHAEGLFYKRMVKERYRDNIKLEEDKIKFCPIALYSNKLLNKGIVSEQEIVTIKEKVIFQIKKSVEFAKESPEPDVLTAITDVFREG